MDWSAFAWFFGGAGATLLGVFAQYLVSTRLEDRRRKTEFYQSRLEKIEPWLAELDCALIDLNTHFIDNAIHVPDGSSERPTKRYWSETSLQMLMDSIDKIHNLRDNPPRVVFASLDPEVAQPLDSLFGKIAALIGQVRTVIYVEECNRRGLQLSEEYEEMTDLPVVETSDALQAEIAVLAGLLKELTLRTDVRRSV